MNLFQHTGEAKYSLVALMNFVDLLLYNASAAQIDNVNAGGVDVPAGSSVTATMTNTEALAYGQLNGAAILQSDASAAEKAAIAVLIAQGTSLETAIQAYQDAVATGNTLIERAARADLDTLGF
jgi:hypothetical protein